MGLQGSIPATTGGMVLTPLDPGYVVADGTEQEVIEYTDTGYLSGYLDLSRMGAGDRVTIKQYQKITEAQGYVEYAQETYFGPQTEPMQHFTKKPSTLGMKVTLTQEAGTYRVFDYRFYEET